MNINHVIERGFRDAMRARWPKGHPRLSRGVAGHGAFYSAVDVGSLDGLRALPYTLVSSGDAESWIPGLANYRMDVTISFVSSKNDNTVEQHEEFARHIGEYVDSMEWIEYFKVNNLALIYTPLISTGTSLEISEEGHMAANFMLRFALCPLV